MINCNRHQWRASRIIKVRVFDEKAEKSADVVEVIMNRLVQIFFAASMRTHGNSELASGVDVEESWNTRSPGYVVASRYNIESGAKQYELGHVKQLISEAHKSRGEPSVDFDT